MNIHTWVSHSIYINVDHELDHALELMLHSLHGQLQIARAVQVLLYIIQKKNIAPHITPVWSMHMQSKIDYECEYHVTQGLCK